MTTNGTVLWGANNIFRLLLDRGDGVEARIRGKVLRVDEGEHNALAPGDRVAVDIDGDSALITDRLERNNRVVRWNRKRHRIQTVAANVDRVCVVTSFRRPPVRPRFVDRVLVMARLESIPPLIVFNKRDLADDASTAYEGVLTDLGIESIACSARTGWGIDEIRAAITGNTTVLFGQSGVGKSSLVNALFPEAHQEVGSVSIKYDRGRHTTTLARRIIVEPGTVLIDTPGVREFDLNMYEPVEIAAGFAEFAPHIPDCAMPSCTHLHEPGCRVRSAVEGGHINESRYDSYARIVSSLEDGS